MSKLAELIAKEEGFGIPGSVPTRDHNPGDLRHSPHSMHSLDDPDGIGVIDNDADGWEDLERQLRLDASRGLTLQQLVFKYAPPEENNSAQYLKYLCDGLGVDPNTTVEEALKIV